MAIEPRRGCGYRVVGGLYLCGSGIRVGCDRLPFPIEYCPTCGSGIKFTQGFTWLDWSTLAGQHEDCSDKLQPCWVCQPKEGEKYGLLWVGEAYYSPHSFIKEALEMGVSKRIPFIPKELKLGETVVLLAHKKACYYQPNDVEEPQYYPGIFQAFKPTAIEMPIYESELTEEKKEGLLKRNITPITIPDGDVDHSDEKTTIAYDPITKTFSRILAEE